MVVVAAVVAAEAALVGGGDEGRTARRKRESPTPGLMPTLLALGKELCLGDPLEFALLDFGNPEARNQLCELRSRLAASSAYLRKLVKVGDCYHWSRLLSLYRLT